MIRTTRRAFIAGLLIAASAASAQAQRSQQYQYPPVQAVTAQHGMVHICVPAAGITRDSLAVKVDKARGMNVSVVTTAKTDEEARKLLQLIGLPFRSN